jgi:hypothetical protein
VRRRDLLGALAAGLLWLPAGRRGRRLRRHAEWEFRLDDRQRWSLVPRVGPDAIVAAEISVRLAGGDATPLGALENVRRFALAPPRGGSTGWQVVGHLVGVEVTAQFLDGPPPVITVTVRGLAAEQTLTEILFFDSASARVAGLEGGDRRAGPARPSRLWISGAESSSDSRVIAHDGTVEATSHWQLAILPTAAGLSEPAGGRGLALAFGAEDAGDGCFAIAAGVAAFSRIGLRPISMALPPAFASLAIVPGAEPLDALGRLATAALPGRATPSGWSSEHALAGGATEAALLANLAAARRRGDAQGFRVIQLDDGFQRSVGDWETNDRFPHGHRWLTDRIHEAGLQAGLWLAPFAVAERSGIPSAHPEWLLQTPEGEPLVVTQREDWGGRVYGLDAGQAAVQDYLRELARHVVRVWGYDCLKLGALSLGVAGTRRGRRMSPAEAYRAGLRALREGAGAAFVLGCDAPLQPSAGLVDGMRVTPGVAARFDRLVPAARASLLRAHLNGTAWINDADAVLVDGSLTEEEARAWASVVALCGGTALASENLAQLPNDRLAILQRVMPVAPVRGRALDVAAPGWTGTLRDAAPAWLLAQVTDDWWMLAAINWDEVPQRLSLSLADHGIRGPLAAYDVWEGARRDDVHGPVALSLPPHGATVLSLRRPRRTPFVLGSTRHVVQGVMDLEDERWDARRRVLSARAVLLDDRPYEVTIALPPGFRPKDARCAPDAGITVDVVERGAARLRLPRPPGAELDWSVLF